MTGEQRRVVRRLLERAWPQIDLMGLIDYFGVGDDDRGGRRLSDAYQSLADEVRFEVPPPSMGKARGPQS